MADDKASSLVTSPMTICSRSLSLAREEQAYLLLGDDIPCALLGPRTFFLVCALALMFRSPHRGRLNDSKML